MERLQGIAVSPGIAIGEALVLDNEGFRIPRRFLPRDAVEEELERLNRAFDAAVAEVEHNRQQVAEQLGDDYAAIFSAHLQMLRDPRLHEEIEEMIRSRHYSPEYAVSRALRRYAKVFQSLEGQYMAERANDIFDIEKRILRNLLGRRREELSQVTSPVLVLAHNLTPSETANLDPRFSLGMVTEIGGPGSHTAIVAEGLRIGQVAVPDQIKFFVLFSVTYDSFIQKDYFSKAFYNLFGQTFDDKQIEGFKSHTLLHFVNGGFTFKYDFLNYYFKAIYLSNFINISEDEKINDKIIKILANDCQYSSVLLEEISRRVNELSEDMVFRISEIADQINNYEVKNYESADKQIAFLKKKAKSGLLALALKLRGNLNNKENNTQLLRNIFAEGGSEFVDLCLLNLKSGLEKLVFNFKNTFFLNCHFESFDNFWNCEMDETTYFENCTLLKLPPTFKSRISIPKTNFHNCIVDDLFEKTFLEGIDREEKIKTQIIDLLKRFFKMFYTNGRLNEQSRDRIIQKRGRSLPQQVFRINRLLSLLKSFKVINIYYNEKYKEHQIELLDEYRFEIDRFCQQGLVTKKIRNIVNYLIENQ